jgi:hypothetical protein
MSARKIERQDLTTRSLLQNAKREDPIVLTFAHLFPFLDDSGCIFPVVDDSGAFPLFLDLSGLVLPVLDVGRASLVGLPRLDKSLHSSLKSRCLSAVSSINCANCNYFAFFLRLTTSLPFRKFEMGSGFGAHFSSAPLASAHPESQKSEIRPLEAVVNSLRQELQIKDWIMRKRLEDEFCLRSLLYGRSASTAIQLLPKRLQRRGKIHVLVIPCSLTPIFPQRDHKGRTISAYSTVSLRRTRTILVSVERNSSQQQLIHIFPKATFTSYTLWAWENSNSITLASYNETSLDEVRKILYGRHNESPTDSSLQCPIENR